MYKKSRLKFSKVRLKGRIEEKVTYEWIKFDFMTRKTAISKKKSNKYIISKGWCYTSIF